MAVLIIFIYGVLLFAIQTSFLPTFAISGVTPDLALIATVFCATRLPGNRGLWVAGLLGLMQDSLTGGILGVNTLSKCIIAHTFCELKGKILVDGTLPLLMFVLIASFFDGLVFYGTTWMLFENPPVPDWFLGKLPLYALYNAIITPSLIYFFNRNLQWWSSRLQTS